MEKRESKVRRSVADLLELPHDIVMDLPKITLVGNLQVHMENHRGIIEYTTEKVRVSINTGEVVIDGRELVLRHILPDQIMVEGRVRAVTFCE
ncbi:sporulation protein [Clostridiales bacterium PH28_bin88]|nr:sporulation protein [Clostridiales bacterium PH28_bin88]